MYISKLLYHSTSLVLNQYRTVPVNFIFKSLIKDIWCSERVNPTFCKSKHSAPLDGTKCNMQGGGVGFCFKAQCLAETASPNRINQDGEWTTWTEWGQCSAVCGTGTKTRRRNCVGKKGKFQDQPTQFCVPFLARDIYYFHELY